MSKFSLVYIMSLIIVFVLGSLYYNNNLPESSTVQISNKIKDTDLPIPPTIKFNVSEKNKAFVLDLFKGCNLSGEKKQLIDACNFSDPLVRDFAVRLASNSPGTYNLGQICDIFDFCFKNWKYVNDPKGEEFISNASETISNQYTGDCDDFAVLLGSSLLAIGGEIRINYAYNGKSGHAFIEVNLGKTDSDLITDYISKRYGLKIINGKKDLLGNWWINLDWFGGSPGGVYFKYKKGQRFYILQKYCESL